MTVHNWKAPVTNAVGSGQGKSIKAGDRTLAAIQYNFNNPYNVLDYFTEAGRKKIENRPKVPWKDMLSVKGLACLIGSTFCSIKMKQLAERIVKF
jgi:hypothetical protein